MPKKNRKGGKPRTPAETAGSSRKQVQQVQVEAQMFSGPLPTPEDLASYNQIIPTAAERILRMAEQQAEHRRKLEASDHEHKRKAARWGQFFGFILALVMALGGIALIWNGKNIAGFSTMILNMTAVASIFVYGRRESRKELEAKRAILSQK